jgi:hypothetical protein
MLTPKEKATIMLKAIQLITKIARWGKGTYTKEEREDLIESLQEFAILVAKEALD